MRSPVRRRTVLAVPLVLALATVLACTDRPGLVEPVSTTPGEPDAPPTERIDLARLDCSVAVASGEVSCEPPVAPADSRDSRALIIYGGQNKYVTLTASGVDYDSATAKFRMNVTVRNLIGQAIGTVDGTVADPGGTMVFFVTPPTMTAGTGGLVNIANADGVDMFTASEQPYFRYVQRIDPFVVSSARTWIFDVPPTVERFAFSVMVAAPVQHPTGWIETSHPVWAMRRTFSRLVTATVYNQFGVEIPGAQVTWTSSNPVLANVPADSGYVSGFLPGTVDIMATSTNAVPGSPAAVQTGKAVFTILGVSQTWTGGGGNTDWNTAANWSRGVSPVPQDSVVVPLMGSDVYPVLTENEEIGGITVADGARIQIGAFNLGASENVVSAPFTGGILSSVGRLTLSGTGKTVSGIVPRTTVTGSYLLGGNLLVDGQLRTQSGRLRNTAFRIRVNGG